MYEWRGQEKPGWNSEQFIPRRFLIGLFHHFPYISAFLYDTYPFAVIVLKAAAFSDRNILAHFRR